MDNFQGYSKDMLRMCWDEVWSQFYIWTDGKEKELWLQAEDGREPGVNMVPILMGSLRTG